MSGGREGIGVPGTAPAVGTKAGVPAAVSPHGCVPVCTAPLHPLPSHPPPFLSSVLARFFLAGIWVLFCFCQAPQGEGRSWDRDFGFPLALPPARCSPELP